MSLIFFWYTNQFFTRNHMKMFTLSINVWEDENVSLLRKQTFERDKLNLISHLQICQPAGKAFVHLHLAFGNLTIAGFQIVSTFSHLARNITNWAHPARLDYLIKRPSSSVSAILITKSCFPVVSYCHWFSLYW